MAVHCLDVQDVIEALGFGTFCHACFLSVGLEDSTTPYEESAPPVEVGQVGQLQTCDKAYEIRNLVNFANFYFDDLVGLEDSIAPFVESGPPVEVGQVGQLQTCEKAYEIRNLVNFANFIR